MYMLWLKFVFGFNFANQFDFDFRLSFNYHNHLFIAHNLEQREITVKLFLKILNQR